MANLLIRSVKPSLIEAVDQAAKAAPAQIDSALSKAGPAITGSVETVVYGFRSVYTDTTAKLAAWLPSMAPALKTQAAKLAAGARKRIDAL